LDHLQAAKEAAALAKAEERRQLQALRSAAGTALLSADNEVPGQLPPAVNTSGASEADRSLLSADNKSNERTASSHSETGLGSADNEVVGQLAPTASASGVSDTDRSLLSADNKSNERSTSSHSETGLLSADNDLVDKAARGVARPPAQRQPGQEAVEPVSPAPAGTVTDSSEAVTGGLDGDGQPRQLPYDDAFYVVNHLHLKMEPGVFAEGARLWLQILREQHPHEYKTLMGEFARQEQQTV
jgi:ParB family chromosome partitioning protein